MDEVVRIVVEVEGGLVRAVLYDHPDGVHAVVYNLDSVNAGDPPPAEEWARGCVEDGSAFGFWEVW